MLSSLFFKLRRNLKYMLTFYYEELSKATAWWLWNVPFQLASIFFSLLIYKYIALAFGGISLLYRGSFMAFIISGLMVNTFLDISLEAYYTSIAALYFGRMGVGGLHISRRDYLQLAGISPYVFVLARVTYQYLMSAITFLLYLIIGVLFFGFRVGFIDVGLVALVIILGIIACSGLGLISASMYWLVSAYRGVEPIRWLIRIMTPLVSGIYVPRQILPRWLKILGDLLPQTYTIDATRKILFKGAGLMEISNELIALVSFSLILVPLGILLLKVSLMIERERGTIY